MTQHDKYDNDILKAMQSIVIGLKSINQSLKDAGEKLNQYADKAHKLTEGDSEDGGV